MLKILSRAEPVYHEGTHNKHVVVVVFGDGSGGLRWHMGQLSLHTPFLLLPAFALIFVQPYQRSTNDGNDDNIVDNKNENDGEW